MSEQLAVALVSRDTFARMRSALHATPLKQRLRFKYQVDLITGTKRNIFWDGSMFFFLDSGRKTAVLFHTDRIEALAPGAMPIDDEAFALAIANNHTGNHHRTHSIAIPTQPKQSTRG